MWKCVRKIALNLVQSLNVMPRLGCDFEAVEHRMWSFKLGLRILLRKAHYTRVCTHIHTRMQLDCFFPSRFSYDSPVRTAISHKRGAQFDDAHTHQTNIFNAFNAQSRCMHRSHIPSGFYPLQPNLTHNYHPTERTNVLHPQKLPRSRTNIEWVDFRCGWNERARASDWDAKWILSYLRFRCAHCECRIKRDDTSNETRNCFARTSLHALVARQNCMAHTPERFFSKGRFVRKRTRFWPWTFSIRCIRKLLAWQNTIIGLSL